MIKIKEEFQSVLPHPSEFENEVSTWKVHVAETEPDDGDDRNRQNLVFACTFAEKNRMYYPNIHTILLLLLTLLLLGPALVNDLLVHVLKPGVVIPCQMIGWTL